MEEEERKLIYRQFDDIGSLLVDIGEKLIYIKTILEQIDEREGGEDK